jgi:hypothetical protein
VLTTKSDTRAKKIKIMTNVTERLAKVYASLKNLAENEMIDITPNDVYTSCVDKFYAALNLPNLHLFETGFMQGAASDDEMFELIVSLNEMFSDDESPIVDYYINEETDKPDFEAVITFLDNKFATAYESALEALENSYITFNESDLREVLETEYENAYKFEWTGWRIPIYANIETNKGTFSAGGWLSGGSYQPDAFEVGKVTPWSLQYEFEEEEEEGCKEMEISNYIDTHIDEIKAYINESEELEGKKIIWK